MPKARSILRSIREDLEEEDIPPEEIVPSTPSEPEATDDAPVPTPPPTDDLDIDPEDLAIGGDLFLSGDPFPNFYERIQRRFKNRKRAHAYVRGSYYERNPDRIVDRIEGVEAYYAVEGVRNTFSSTTWLVWEDGNISLRYHETDIMVITPDSVVTVDSGGWTSKNTLARLDMYLPNYWQIASKLERGDPRGGSWFWYNRDSGWGTYKKHMLIEFTDGDFLTPDGTLHIQTHPTANLPYKKDFPASGLRW